MKKVLVVDDNKGILEALRAALTFFGHEVRCALCGVEAFESVETFKPDVIFLDLLLSGESGADICRRLKENDETKHVKVVMMSAHPSAENIVWASGADDFLAKPFRLDELVEMTKRSNV